MKGSRIFRNADFQWMEELPGKPILFLKENEHYQTPEDIIGVGRELELIRKHLREFNTPAIEKWHDQERKLVAELYATLRRHGWYNPQLDSFGRVCFGSPYSNI